MLFSLNRCYFNDIISQNDNAIQKTICSFCLFNDQKVSTDRNSKQRINRFQYKPKNGVSNLEIKCIFVLPIIEQESWQSGRMR